MSASPQLTFIAVVPATMCGYADTADTADIRILLGEEGAIRVVLNCKCDFFGFRLCYNFVRLINCLDNLPLCLMVSNSVAG